MAAFSLCPGRVYLLCLLLCSVPICAKSARHPRGYRGAAQRHRKLPKSNPYYLGMMTWVSGYGPTPDDRDATSTASYAFDVGSEEAQSNVENAEEAEVDTKQPSESGSESEEEEEGGEVEEAGEESEADLVIEEVETIVLEAAEAVDEADVDADTGADPIIGNDVQHAAEHESGELVAEDGGEGQTEQVEEVAESNPDAVIIAQVAAASPPKDFEEPDDNDYEVSDRHNDETDVELPVEVKAEGYFHRHIEPFAVTIEGDGEVANDLGITSCLLYEMQVNMTNLFNIEMGEFVLVADDTAKGSSGLQEYKMFFSKVFAEFQGGMMYSGIFVREMQHHLLADHGEVFQWCLDDRWMENGKRKYYVADIQTGDAATPPMELAALQRSGGRTGMFGPLSIAILSIALFLAA